MGKNLSAANDCFSQPGNKGGAFVQPFLQITWLNGASRRCLGGGRSQKVFGRARGDNLFYIFVVLQSPSPVKKIHWFIFVSEYSKTCFLFQLKIQAGMVFSNRGDEVSMSHFKEIDFWLTNIIVWHGGS